MLYAYNKDVVENLLMKEKVFNEAIRLGLILSTISDTILSRFCLIKELFFENLFKMVWDTRCLDAGSEIQVSRCRILDGISKILKRNNFK